MFETKYTPLHEPEARGPRPRLSLYAYTGLFLLPILSFLAGRYSYQWSPPAVGAQDGVELSSDIFFGDGKHPGSVPIAHITLLTLVLYQFAGSLWSYKRTNDFSMPSLERGMRMGQFFHLYGTRSIQEPS